MSFGAKVHLTVEFSEEAWAQALHPITDRTNNTVYQPKPEELLADAKFYISGWYLLQGITVEGSLETP